jgi:predicted Fe-Mo cluster-binding NifX family protein
MKIVVTAEGAGLDAPASRVFGRCQTYVFVATDSMAVESVENPAIDSPSGAGIEAAQFVVEQGAETVVTGNVGPNAFSVLEAAGVPVYLLGEGTVGEVVEAFKEGQLAEAGGATGPAHAGMGRGGGMGRGTGRGRGMARGALGDAAPASLAGKTGPGGGSAVTREDEIAELQGMAAALRRQLAEVIERLDQLEKEA